MAGGCGSWLTTLEEEEEVFEEHPGSFFGEAVGSEESWVDFCSIPEVVGNRDRCTSLRCPSRYCDSVLETSWTSVLVEPEEVCSSATSPYWNPAGEVVDLAVMLVPRVD